MNNEIMLEEHENVEDVKLILKKKLKDVDVDKALDLISKFVDFGKEYQKSKREIKKFECARDILIKKIETDYKKSHEIISKVFSERDKVINKSFEIIDKGLKDNDKDLIIQGLQQASNIVLKSPFGTIDDLHKMIESGQEIDFSKYME